MEETRNWPRSAEKLSWRCTVVTQAVLCLALYGALRIGTPQASWNPGLSSKTTERRESPEVYFLSVRGGFWPADEQTQLLQQMSRAAKFYKAKFVVNIAELGEDDTLTQNATSYFPFLKIPWYTTMASNTTIDLSDMSKKCFFKKIKIAYDQILYIVGLDTGDLQKDFQHLEHEEESGSYQLQCLQQIFSVTDIKWLIVAGFHSFMNCEKPAEKSAEVDKLVHRVFLKHGVNIYLSQPGCAGQVHHADGIAYLGNPGPSHQQGTEGFLLHRVSPLEIESYFIDTAGNVVSMSKKFQNGREVM